jgi:hypothetical protein
MTLVHVVYRSKGFANRPVENSYPFLPRRFLLDFKEKGVGSEGDSYINYSLYKLAAVPLDVVIYFSCTCFLSLLL